MVEGNADEYLHNAAKTLGFKTTSTKLFFWIIIMFLGILAISTRKELDSGGKTMGIGAVIILGVISGFYLKFIPTAVFIFLLFVMAVVASIVWYKIFGSGANM